MAYSSPASGPQYVTAAPQPELLVGGAATFFAALSILPSMLLSEQTFGAHAVQTYNAEALKSQVWGSAYHGVTPPVASSATTQSAAPQIDAWYAAGVYYSFRAASQSGGGLPSEYLHGTHAVQLYNAEAQKTSQQWQSAPGGTVTTNVLGQEFLHGTHAAQLYDAEARKSQLWRTTQGVAGASGFLGRFFVGQPQPYDYTQQALYVTLNFRPQGYIFPWLEAEPQGGQEVQPAPVAVPASPAGPAKYLLPPPQSAAPQSVDLTQQPVYSKSAASAQGPTVRSFVAGPQPLDLTLQPRIFPLVEGQQGPTVPSFAVPPQAYDPTLPAQVWRSQRTAQRTAHYTLAAPQQFDFTLPAAVRGSVRTPPVVVDLLGHYVVTAEQPQDRPAVVRWPALFRSHGSQVLGAFAQAAPWVPTSWPPSAVWPPFVGLRLGVSKIGAFDAAAPSQFDQVGSNPHGQYFFNLAPTTQRQFGWALVLALKQLGVQGLNQVVASLSQSGIQGARSKFLNGSACFVTIAYYDNNNLPFAPAQVQYRIDDLVSQENILPWTPISPAVENQVVVTSVQNTMISLTRQHEAHQVLFQITDGYEDVFYARVIYDLVRAVGTPGDIEI